MTDVTELNNKIVSLFQDIADNVLPRKRKDPAALSSKNSSNAHKKRKGTRMKPKNSWFDSQCICAKRAVNRLAKKYGKDPHNIEIRNQYYTSKRDYRKLIRSKKADFIAKLSKDVKMERT